MTDSQVRVVVRIRPLLAHEPAANGSAAKGRGVHACKSPDGAPAVLLRDDVHEAASAQNASAGCAETLFTFDGVYEPSSTNTQLFDAEVGPHLGRLFTGSSVTLFAFGMTGTGKSHSMQGSATDPGLIPRSIGALFDSIADRVASGEQEWSTTSVAFSFFELYNEKIYDLLKPYAPPSGAAAQTTDRGSSDSAARVDPALLGDLPVREDATGKVFVSNLSESRLDSLATFQKLYSRALSNRRVAATKLNAHSSRSHSMALVKMEFRSTKAPFKRICSRIQMLDLAGNEDNRHSGNTASSKRMIESAKINNSLFVLGKVINALNGGEARVPYRDSKLTRLLQDSLGGSNYSIMLCNISPNLSHMVWTLRTLQFASKSKQIVNTVSQNVTEVPVPPTAAEVLADQKAKLDAWRAAQGRSVSSASSSAAAATASSSSSAAAAAASKAKRLPSTSSSARPASAYSFSVSNVVPSGSSPNVDMTALSAKIATQNHKGFGPAMMRQLNTLVQHVSSIMDVQKQQQQQQQQQKQLPPQQRPASAQPALLAPSSTPLIPLTPMSSASLARISVEKARVWERAGATQQALAEYKEAARIRPGNEKLAQKIAQLEAKMAGGGASANATAAATPIVVAAASAAVPSAVASASNLAALSGAKRGREQLVLSHRSKQARVSDASCIAEEDENAEEDEDDAEAEGEEEEEEEEEEEVEEDDESMSEASGSDYDPDEADAPVDALWTKRNTRAGARSNSNSAETSPSAPSSLLQRIEAAAATTTSKISTPPAAAAPVAKNKLVTPPAATAAAAHVVRTPLATLTHRPSSAAAASLSVATGVLKLKSSAAPSSTLTAPTAASAARDASTAAVSVSPAATAASANKENASPASNHLNAPKPATGLKDASNAVTKPSKLLTKPAPVAAAPLPTAAAVVPVAAPAPVATAAPGLLLSDLVSGRDSLVRVLNTGSLKDLMNLQTIGKKRAQLILAKREEIGAYVTLADLSAIGLSATQVEQFTQRNLMSSMWTNANAITATGSSNMED